MRQAESHSPSDTRPTDVFVLPPRHFDATDAEVSLWRAKARDAVRLGVNPMAPHIYFPTFLSPAVFEEQAAISAGYRQWLAICGQAWCCPDAEPDRELVSLSLRLGKEVYAGSGEWPPSDRLSAVPGVVSMFPPGPRVYICSPLFGDGRSETMARNMVLARHYSRSAALQGCTPFTPHIYYPTFLDEHDPELRAFGLGCGIEWLKLCEEIWVCADETGSRGMAAEIDLAAELGIRLRYRFNHPLAAIDDRLVAAM